MASKAFLARGHRACDPPDGFPWLEKYQRIFPPHGKPQRLAILNIFHPVFLSACQRGENV